MGQYYKLMTLKTRSKEAKNTQNEKIEDCIRIGNECGGRACEYVGGNEWTTHQ